MPSAQQVASRFLLARATVVWPRLKGMLIELTKGESLKPSGAAKEGQFDRGDTFELTGRVMRAAPARYLFEGFLESPTETYWVPNTIRSFGPTPHTMSTPQGEELGPDYFGGSTSVGEWEKTR